MQYIVFDLEFNQAFPFKTGTVAQTQPDCPFEIIQIGAVKLNDALETVAQFNEMICPQIYPRIHPFVEKITGITRDQLKDKPDFPKVFRAFQDFIGKEETVFCTWGGDDLKALFNNVLHYQLDLSTLSNQIINVQEYASKYLGKTSGQAIGLKNAVDELQLPTGDQFHDAFYDAVYTAEVFRVVRPKEVVPKTFFYQPPTEKKERIRTDIKALLQQFEKSLERDLTEEEQQLIKKAYKLGRNHAFDVKVEKSTKKK